MKKLLTTAFLSLVTIFGIANEVKTSIIEPSLKFGKPSDEELSMSTYAPDTTASAVVLYSLSNTRYDVIANEFQVAYDYQVKIKILKADGTSYANVIIPYYMNEKSSLVKEVVSGINASSYNMEKGKMVRTKMDSDLIFKERINKNYMQIKFTIPNVKVGTILEYKYTLTSDLYYRLLPWEAQKDIPVLFTQHEIKIPEYFNFNLEMRGRNHLETKDQSDNQQFTINYGGGQSERVNCSARNLTFTGHQLPALKTDKYIWCAENYRSGVLFELSGINFPNSPYKSFTKNWKEIDDLLLDDDDFGGRLKMRNPYRDEMPSLGLDKTNNIYEKIATLYSFLKKKISWNNDYALYSYDTKKAAKNGTGSNADINFILMSLLKDAKIDCYPAVMSRRSRGILPMTHPSIDKLNTFVIAIADTDSTLVYLDGSSNTGFLNILPPNLMVERAHVIGYKNGETWVNLSQCGKSLLRGAVNATIASNGIISGQRQTKYIGQYASGIRKEYHSVKDSSEFIRNLETQENIKITQFNLENVDLFSPEVKESFNFEKQATLNGDLIYVNPLIFLHMSKCPFTDVERNLPLEMPYQEEYSLSVILRIPEGYTVDELPKSTSINSEDGQSICRYYSAVNQQTVSIKYVFKQNKLLYLSTEYPSLKKFFETIVEKNNEMLVLKKADANNQTL
ncbi:MAG: DUF3857 domain-containing protein [Bacteroides sp.]